MEVDSLISGNKTLDNKSYLSLNYIYRKVIIKENFENSKKELRSLNYEKIAKYYMKYMNLKLILESIFKLKKSLNKNNPLLKYIKDAQPYNFISIKIDITSNRSLLKEYYKNKNINKINKNSFKNDKIINFVGKKRNFYFGRMCNIDYKRVIHNRNEKIILIQKHIRGFLSKKIIDEEVNKIIAKRIINKILIIQRTVKNFLTRKKSLDKLIVNVIHNERITKSNKIADIFSLYHFRNLYKKNLIIKKILKIRNDSVLLIQNKFRLLIFNKKVKEIIKKEKKSYVLTYPFKAETVQIKIYMNMSYKLYNYFICPIRKYFVLYIDKGSIDAGEYLCHMIVNNNVILDKRYKYIVDKNNILYNLIYIGQQPLLPIKDNFRNDKKDKDIKKKKQKNNDIIDDNDFYFYCYNDNSHSTNSLSTKSDHDKNRIKEENNSYKISNQNKFLKQNKKREIGKNKGKIPIFPSKNKYNNFFDINTGNINKNKICIKQRDFESYFRDLLSKLKEPKPKQSISSFDNITSEKEEDIENQKMKYSNILDELSSSISSTKSNFSLKKLNSYSKKTHRAKFNSNLSARLSSKKISSNSLSNSNTLPLNINHSFRNRIFRIKKSK
jgi:hypothetical protein